MASYSRSNGLFVAICLVGLFLTSFLLLRLPQTQHSAFAPPATASWHSPFHKQTSHTNNTVRLPQTQHSAFAPPAAASWHSPFHKQTSHTNNTVRTQVTLEEVIQRFREKTSPHCPASARRSLCQASQNISRDSPLCRQTTLTWDQLKEFIRGKASPVSLLSDSEYFLQFETQLLNTPDLTDTQSLPSVAFSRVTYVGRVPETSRVTPVNKSSENSDNEVHCAVGEVLSFRVDLIDGYNRPRVQGMDDVRAWVVETNTSRPRRAAAEVEDLNNGSYRVYFRCLWPSSKSCLRVAVAYPREYQKRVLVMRRRGLYMLAAGQFSKAGGISETTPCLSTPNIQWPCLCNLTEWNQASFYCGRPRDERLNCSHLTHMANLDTMNLQLGTTLAERHLMKSIASHINNRAILRKLFLVTGQSSIKVQPPPELKSCKSLGPQITWDTREPTGFFDTAGVWQSSQCRTSTLTQPLISKCFRNLNIMLFGDSNAIRIKNEILALLQPPAVCWGGSGKWTANETCTRADLNFKLTFDPHEYQLHLSSWQMWPVYTGEGVASHIDKIPSSGRYLVVVHYFLHTQTEHLVVVRNRLIKFKEAIQRAVARNPDVTFAFRGPHVSSVEWIKNHSTGGDTLGVFYLQLIKEIFNEVRDHLVFLDGWEMTVAIENIYFHPHSKIPQAMLRRLLSFVCGE